MLLMMHLVQMLKTFKKVYFFSMIQTLLYFGFVLVLEASYVHGQRVMCPWVSSDKISNNISMCFLEKPICNVEWTISMSEPKE